MSRTKTEGKYTAIERVNILTSSGSRQSAVETVAREMGVSHSTVYNWLRRWRSAKPGEQLAALAAQNVGRTAIAKCDPRAWEFLVASSRQGHRPTFASVHRQMKEEAAKQGWDPIPSAKTLQRRLKRTIGSVDPNS